MNLSYFYWLKVEKSILMFSRLTCEPFRVKLKIKKYLETMASYQMIFHSLKLPFVSSISLKGSTFHPAFDNFVILFF